MSEKLWCPPEKHVHDLPDAYKNQDCVFRCGTCNHIFQSKEYFGTGYWGYDWKQRSERWLKRRLRKAQNV